MEVIHEQYATTTYTRKVQICTGENSKFAGANAKQKHGKLYIYIF